jgi:hypothetical protein
MSDERDDWRSLLPDGHVQCPRLGGVVALARCLECNWLLDLDRAACTPALRCAAASPIADGRDDGPRVRHVD